MGQQTEGTLRHALLTGLAIATLAAGVHGQNITAGQVLGVVTNREGNSIPDAIVTLRDLATGLERWAETSPDGRFSFSLLYPGTYELKAEQLGYRPPIVRTIRLQPGERLM